MVPTRWITISRRRFLKFAVLSPLVGAVAPVRTLAKLSTDRADPSGFSPKNVPHLNPGFRLRKVSDEEVALCTQLEDGRGLTHRVGGLAADLLLGIERENSMEKIVETLCRRRRLSTADCRKRIRRALNAFKENHWIYYDEKLSVTRVEIHRV